jgi:hypothetical protein
MKPEVGMGIICRSYPSNKDNLSEWTITKIDGEYVYAKRHWGDGCVVGFGYWASETGILETSMGVFELEPDKAESFQDLYLKLSNE